MSFSNLCLSRNWSVANMAIVFSAYFLCSSNFYSSFSFSLGFLFVCLFVFWGGRRGKFVPGLSKENWWLVLKNPKLSGGFETGDDLS